jgi:hypothetical protein
MGFVNLAVSFSSVFIECFELLVALVSANSKSALLGLELNRISPLTAFFLAVTIAEIIIIVG